MRERSWPFFCWKAATAPASCAVCKAFYGSVLAITDEDVSVKNAGITAMMDATDKRRESLVKVKKSKKELNKFKKFLKKAGYKGKVKKG